MKATDSPASSSQALVLPRRWYVAAFGIVLALIGLILGAGGLQLAILGGSWYYLIAGLLMLVSGILFVRRNMVAIWVYAAVFAGTLVWAFYEAGLRFWPLVPRLAPVLVLGLCVALILGASTQRRIRRAGQAGAATLSVVLVAGVVAMFFQHGVIENPAPEGGLSATPVIRDPADPANRWEHYGRSAGARFYAPFDQIDKNNVGKLKVAWTYHTGVVSQPHAKKPTETEYQVTPIQIGDSLYLCTPDDQVIALDAESGQQRWRYDPKLNPDVFWRRCRGVSYYEVPATDAGAAAVATAAQPRACRRRIFNGTGDARLIALDADTGKPCEDFGDHGTVDLTVGMGEVPPGFFSVTSQPTVVHGKVLVGGWVWDNQSIDMPSGVVRAYDARTGELAWAWDLGNPSNTGLPGPGQTYTRSTPNVWGTITADEKLGLVYLPTGNPAPDFWTGKRRPFDEEYLSSIVALNADTGREVWKFQTTHMDHWDYDNSAPPILYDIPDGKGGTLPALVRVGKTAQIFVLDRRNGKPVFPVEERPVPQDSYPGDRLSPTQPFSVAMPQIGVEKLTEQDMWGATPFDQLYCRIKFRQSRWEGQYTPITEKPTLMYPAWYGGTNWGGATIDETRGLLILPDIRFVHRMQLLPKDGSPRPKQPASHGTGIAPMDGTPYEVFTDNFVSFLDIPCQNPPFGAMSAVDLRTGKLVWQRPLGTVRDNVVLGTKVGLPLPLGVPPMGTGVATASGLTFFAGALDYYLRAFDNATGEEVWKARLPVGSQATPMSYLGPRSGRQFVVIVAGGARAAPDKGDYVIAYALDNPAKATSVQAQ